LAFTFAANGKRVLIYDCDSQRSVTSALLGLHLLDDKYTDEVSPLTFLINRPIKLGFHRTLYDQIIDNERNAKPCEALPITNNIWLVPGSREMNNLDTLITLEESYARNVLPFHLNQKTGKSYSSIIQTAKHHEIDYVFLDLNPNKGVFNRCLIFSSHYIIVPALADFHSSEMMSSMKTNLVNWYNEFNVIRTETLPRAGKATTDFPLPAFSPKFLGFILNKIDSNNIGEIINGIEVNTYRHTDQVWKRKIELSANEISTLNYGLAISSDIYSKCHRSNNLGIIRNFNTLKNISDIVHIPVPFLLDRHFIDYDHVNDIVRNMSPQNKQRLTEKTVRFRQVFQEIYNTIQMIISLV
jgi:cellulose biosynthesis protein BcsQ